MADVISEWFAQQLKAGLDPRVVGDQGRSAIHEERFYVLTHPQWQSQVEHRARCVSSGENPSVLPPTGIESLIQKLAKLRAAK